MALLRKMTYNSRHPILWTYGIITHISIHTHTHIHTYTHTHTITLSRIHVPWDHFLQKSHWVQDSFAENSHIAHAFSLSIARSLSLSHACALSLYLALSLSLTHTHTYTHTVPVRTSANHLILTLSLSPPPPPRPPRARGRSEYSAQMRVISKLTDSLCVSLAFTLGIFVQSVLGVRTCVCEFASHTRTRIHTYTHI